VYTTSAAMTASQINVVIIAPAPRQADKS